MAHEQQLELGIQTPTAAQSPWLRLRDYWWPAPTLLYDRVMLWLSLALLGFSLIMVTSASFPVGERLTDNPFYFMIRHSLYLLLGLGLLAITVQVPMQWWYRASGYLLLGAIGGLLVVLLIGHEVNGAKRWLKFGPLTLQAAEIAKLCFVVYMASYLTRRFDQVQENLQGFLKPLFVFLVFAALLLLQPDFGSMVVMVCIVTGMLFLAGARLWQFFALLMGFALLLTLLIIKEPYRMRRVVSFLDPWQDPFGSGYQLTQSLMAFGRGHWFGEGLGNSIQKLQYLPEAHTDFIMAVVGEELGFSGILMVLIVVFAMIFRAMQLGRKSLHQGQQFNGFIAYGVAIWFAFQAMVNIGAAAGLLPTKGLTLPLISYGGTSLLISCVTVGLLLRVDYELRLATMRVAPLSQGGRS